MSFRYMLFVFLLVTGGLSAQKYCCIVYTIPKSGTHLIEKFFTLLLELGYPAEYIRSHFGKELRKKTHVDPEEGLRQLFNPKIKKIILVRDPRDMFVSAIHYLDKNRLWIQRPRKKQFYSEWRSLETNVEKISYLMGVNMDNYINKSFEDCFKKAIACSKIPNSFVVRFEDLVGAQGGGDIAIQRKTINKILRFIKLKLKAGEKDWIVKNLFASKGLEEGGFFRKGQIGTWPQYFKKGQRKKFNHKYGFFLDYFGYAR